MTATTARLPALFLESRFSRVLGAISAFFEGIREGKQMANRYAYLSRLSDTDLAARGLTRAEIVHAVVNG
jgi:hypothetical protein